MIWTDPEARPEPFSGKVIPVEPKGKTLESEPSQSDVEMDDSYTDENSSSVERDDHGLRDLLPDGSDDVNVQSGESDNSAESESQPEVQRTNTKATTADHTGQQFLDWLRENVRNGALTVDTPNSRICNVPEGIFLVSPAIFKEFVEKTGSELSWEQVQKRFLKLNVHTKTPDGLNVHTHNMNGALLHGIVLSEFEL